MGEVYRARDTRLGREVAIKVLPEGFAGDVERVARFEREARSASALSHAHVVSVFDVGRAGESFYIVTEIVAGGNLRDLMDRGSLPLRRALDLSVQIASGLAEAHESGIVHRDLKPENILLTKTGDAKIADFGLAKLAETGSAGMSQLPTSDGLKTSDGIVMGTVAYMSPEQAGGRSVDFRSDQFAFGTILYEMLAGRPPFRRSTAGETMAAVLRDEPAAVRSINGSVPPQLAWILDRCLSKAPEGRYASTRDLALELAFLRDHFGESAAESEVGARPALPAARSSRLPWIAAALSLLAALLLGAVWWRDRRRPSRSGVVRFSLPPPPNTTFFSRLDGLGFAFSPDGSRLAFLGDPNGSSREVAPTERVSRRVWVRALADSEARALPGTDGAASLFWSPDGRSVGFFAEGKLKRVGLDGGAPTPICDISFGRQVAASWGAGDILLGSTFEGIIYRVAAEGGTPVPFIKPNAGTGETRAMWPHFLPDGKSFLYASVRREGASNLKVAYLDGRPSKVVAAIASRTEYVDPGLLVFASDGALFAQRFDAGTSKVTGPLVSLAPAVDYFYTSKWAAFSASRSGNLAFAPRGNITRLTWIDRSGRVLGEIGSLDAGETISLALSADGRLAYFDRTRPDLGTYDVWMIDLARGAESRLTSAPNTEFDPVPLPDGKHIVYSVVRDYLPQLVLRDLATGAEEPLLPAGSFQEGNDVTADGQQLLFSQNGAKGEWGIWSVSLSGEHRVSPVAVSRASQTIGRLSPDGKLVAYLSNESGQQDAYLEATGAKSQKIRVSTGGATLLRWSRDGKEIFFASPDRHLFAVDVTSSPRLRVSSPKLLFAFPTGDWTAFDVAADGRFLAAIQHVAYASEPLRVVVNAMSEIRP